MVMESINPATGEVVEVFEELSDEQLGLALNASERAGADWAGTPFPQRRDVLQRAAALLREQKGELGALITREMGKPVR